MALIEQKINESEGVLEVSAPGYECDCVQVLTPEHNKWFSEYLCEENLTLVRMVEGFTRLSLRVGSDMSLQRFRPNIVVTGSEPFEEDKWVDLQFKSTSTGTKTNMKVTVPCQRCPVPNIDPVTATPNENKEPSMTMKTFRTGDKMGLEKQKWKGQLFFGVQIDHSSQEGMTLSVGDELVLLPGNESQWFGNQNGDGKQ
eukprot:gene36740-45322_t